MGKDGFRHGGTADIAMANHEDFYFIFHNIYLFHFHLFFKYRLWNIIQQLKNDCKEQDDVGKLM